MPVTQIYVDWIKKAQECGFNNEQICGLSMLYCWNQTFRTKDSREMDVDSFWGFVSQESFVRNKQITAFHEELADVISTFQDASDFLKLHLEQKRYTSDGELTDIFTSTVESPGRYQPKLLEKHNFDLEWLERLGLSLAQEHRDPEIAYAFAERFSEYLFYNDPQAFHPILSKILRSLSPFISIFTDTGFVNKISGYLPFQLALAGFMGGNKIDESVWTLQRFLFYKQPGGDLIREGFQKLSPRDFLNESLAIVEPIINENREFYFSLSSEIPSEYVLEANTRENFFSRLRYLLEQRYQITETSESSDPANILINVACFSTVCHLLIKNISNPLKAPDNVRMVTDEGLLWSLGKYEGSTELAALTYFPKILPWRSGVCSVMFFETQKCNQYFLYLPAQDDITFVDQMFHNFALALSARECTFSYFADLKGKDENEEDPQKMVVLLTSNQFGFKRAIIQQVNYSSKSGFVCDDDSSVITDETFFKGFLDDVRQDLQIADEEKRLNAQLFIKEEFPAHDWDGIFEDEVTKL